MQKTKQVLFNGINTVNKFLTILNTSRLLTCFYLKFPSQNERFNRGNSRLIKTMNPLAQSSALLLSKAIVMFESNTV